MLQKFLFFKYVKSVDKYFSLCYNRFVSLKYNVKLIIEYIKSFQVNYIPNIVLSRDAYNYQLVDDNTIILRPHKTVSSQSGLIDESIIINRYNAIKEYCKVILN